MTLSSKVRNLLGSGVFKPGGDVSKSRMSTSSIAVAAQARAQSQAENATIAQGLKRQDAELLDQLIVQYQHRLLRYLVFLTGNRELAEDLFQDTWMRVLQRGSQYNGTARFDTWLFTIARNLLIDVRRKRSVQSLDELCATGDDERPVEFAAAGPSPFDLYQNHQNGQHLAAAMLKLDPLHREVLVLRFHEELSLEEISRVTSAPLSTVKSRLYRGLAALKPRVEMAQASPGGTR